MAYVFNGILVLLVALIAYWWANQGLLSAFLHFVCVVVAGAIALALWEPLVVNVLLSGGGFDDYAWGITLVLSFTLLLFVLRLACDKLVPDNLNFPTWLNYTAGTAFGAGAGIITVGIFVIGAGFMQSTAEIMGFIGVARDMGNRGQPTRIQAMYPPIHEWTEDFYAFLSAGAYRPVFSNGGLNDRYPTLAAQAVSLHRDSFADGSGKTSLAPSGVSVEGFYFCPSCQLPGEPGQGVYGVQLGFNQASFDYGEMLTLSSAQARLIGTPADRWSAAPVAYPVRWVQPTAEQGVREFAFDDLTNYATSIPGQQSGPVFLMFSANEFGSVPPEFVQVKGLRLRLPQVTPTDEPQWMAAKMGGGGIGGLELDPSAPRLAANDVKIDNRIAPLNITSNQLSPMEEVDKFITRGKKRFPRNSPFSGSRKLRIQGINEPPGTKIVKVDVSRKKSSIDLFDDTSDVRARAGAGAPPLLVDDRGAVYRPIGYMWLMPDEVELMVEPSTGISSIEDIPNLPSSGTHELFLLYRVTEGARIAGFALGDVTVGTCDVVVE